MQQSYICVCATFLLEAERRRADNACLTRRRSDPNIEVAREGQPRPFAQLNVKRVEQYLARLDEPRCERIAIGCCFSDSATCQQAPTQRCQPRRRPSLYACLRACDQPRARGIGGEAANRAAGTARPVG